MTASSPKPQAYRLYEPSAPALPLVVDSPHSWLKCPPGVNVAAPESTLMTGCDAYVDELFDHVPAVGGTLISACFPRWLVDANRARTDIDVELLAEAWPHKVNPTEKVKLGMGVVRRYAVPGVPVHGGPLPVATVEGWLRDFYDPYHEVIRSELDNAYASHEAVWHINCHSMKSVGNAMNTDNGKTRPDFVVSNRDGKTSSAEFLHVLAAVLRNEGFNVGVNDPYKGAHLIDAYSNPDQKRHSVQIEVNRALYMDQQTFEKNQGFASVQKKMAELIDEVAAYVRTKLK